MTFTAGFGDDAQTRASIEYTYDDVAAKYKGHVSFVANDKISIFSANNTNVEFTTTVGGAEATFDGTAIAGDGTYYAIYPYSSSYTFSAGEVSDVFIPYEQDAAASSPCGWDPSAPIAYATTTGSNLQFHNACALLKVTNDTGDGATISVGKEDGPEMTGHYNLNTSNGTLTGNGQRWGVARVADVPNGKTIYIAIVPGTYSGFNVNWKTDNINSYPKTKSDDVTFEAGKIYDLGYTSSWMPFVWYFPKMSWSYDDGYTYGDVKFQGEGDLTFEGGELSTMGNCTFTALSGKKFTKIVINATYVDQEDDENWTVDESNSTATWEGDASPSVSINIDAEGISSIAFYFE